MTSALEAQAGTLFPTPFLSEPEAAGLLGYSAKRLADLRRGGIVPRDTYVQKFRGGRVRYLRRALLRWFAGSEKV